MEVVVVDAQNDSAKQINDVEDLMRQGVNILLINPTDSLLFQQLYNPLIM